MRTPSIHLHPMSLLRSLTLLSVLVATAIPVSADTPAFMSARSVGHVLDDHVAGLVTDALGNTYFSGDFIGTVNVGGDSLTSFYDFGGIQLSTRDVFVAKYDANGAHVWSKSYGSTSGEETTVAMAVDPSGNTVITGTFLGSASLGGGVLNSGTIFVAKYDGNGDPLWSLSTGISASGASAATVTAVACDATGHIYLSGHFRGTVTIASGVVVSAGSDDAFLAKYDPNGVAQWVFRYGGTGADRCEDVMVDPLGGVLLTGRYQGSSVSFGGLNLPMATGSSTFLVKLTQTAGYAWGLGLGLGAFSVGTDIATDAVGNVVITGEFNGSADFGGGPLQGTAGTRDIFLARYTPNGTHVWSQAFSGSAFDRGNAVAIDSQGNILLTGYFGNVTGALGYTVDFGENVVTSSGEADVFLARFDADGVDQWAVALGSDEYDEGVAVVAGANDDVVMAGMFRRSMPIPGGVLTSRGLEDVFLLRYSGIPAEPLIQSVVDIGNDEGRAVRVTFRRSGIDGRGRAVPALRYDAYRRDDSSPAVAGSQVDLLRDAGWQYVASVPAHGEDTYVIRCATLGDSTSAGPYRSHFFVRAVTDDPFTFYDSRPDSGSSVDNLAPSAPFDVTYDQGTLTWSPSTAGDFDHFVVYGAERNVFDAARVVDTSTDATLDVAGARHAFYFVTAVDAAGNESAPASTVGETTANGTSRIYALSVSNHPNPFNPSTMVEYTVPTRGRVTVAIYDARGARVRTLVDGKVHEAGSHTTEWDGRADSGAAVTSGVYFARVECAGAFESKKLVLLK